LQSLDSSIILDASAFYAGIPFLGSSKCYTTNDVFDEIKHIKKSISAIETLIETGNLRIKEPSLRSMDMAKKIAQKSGDLPNMSKADLSVLALALELKDSNPLLVTDDYAIANVAKLSNIKVSYVMTEGIRKVGKWLRYCPACHKSYSENEKICSICGNKLRRKLRYKKH